MKKIAFIVVLIAVVVAMVFGGLSLASAAPAGKPTPTPTSTPPPTVTPTPKPASAVYMETRTGSAGLAGNGTQLYIYNENYPKISHVSITLQTRRMASGAALQVWIAVGGVMSEPTIITADGVYVLEYDTPLLQFFASAPGAPFAVYYNITITYQS